MISADRDSLVDLLRRWQSGENSHWTVVNEAEAAEEALFGNLEAVPASPRTDPNSVGLAVLELLADAHVQRVLPEDIPAILKFLAVETGQELEAWQDFDAYWDSVDFAAREELASRLYFPAKDESAG